MQRINANPANESHKGPKTPWLSLFKFRLYFLSLPPNLQRRQALDHTWFSYDKPDERAMFPSGVHEDFRPAWTRLHQQAQQLGQQYTALCRLLTRTQPHYDPKTDQVRLYVHPDYAAHLESINRSYLPWIQEQLSEMSHKSAQFLYWDDPKSRLIGLSPAQKADVNFSGIQTFENSSIIRTWFLEGFLSKVLVYDNLCYTPNNLIGQITIRDYGHQTSPPRPAPAQPSAVRTNTPRPLGQLISQQLPQNIA